MARIARRAGERMLGSLARAACGNAKRNTRNGNSQRRSVRFSKTARLVPRDCRAFRLNACENNDSGRFLAVLSSVFGKRLMYSRRSRRTDKAGASAERPAQKAENEAPMERFTSLTRALLTVSNKQLKEEQLRYEKSRRGKRRG
jgi:hypothetical protein